MNYSYGVSKRKKPEVIVLHLDTMVLNNDGAKKREGCNVTYKRILGFQPLQINWGFLYS